MLADAEVQLRGESLADVHFVGRGEVRLTPLYDSRPVDGSPELAVHKGADGQTLQRPGAGIDGVGVDHRRRCDLREMFELAQVRRCGMADRELDCRRAAVRVEALEG